MKRKMYRNKFAGADDIYLTKNRIARRDISSWFDKNGRYHMSDKTRYFKKTPSNLKEAELIAGHLRYGRK